MSADITNSSLNNSDREDSFDLRQNLTKYFHHWRYFVVSIIVTSAIAIAYLYFSTPVYEIKATLLIQDGKNSIDERSSLQEIEGTHSSKMVENEIEVLQSRNLILQVVQSLQLETRYHLKDGYKKVELYANRPVRVELLGPVGNVEERNFEISIQDNKTFFVKDSTGIKGPYKFNHDYKLELGAWKLETSNYINEFIGETVHISVQRPERIAETYQKNLEVLMINKDAPVVSLKVEDVIEQRGKDFLNALIEMYNTESISEKAQRNQSTINFIDQRLAALSGELYASEGEVETFRSSRGITNISSQAQVYLENVQTNDIRLNEVNVQLNIIEGIQNYLDASETAENLPSLTGISDASLNHLIQQLLQLQNKKAELLATTPESNPIFNPLNHQINSTRSAVKNNITSTRLALLNTKRELESFHAKFESTIRDIPGQERQLVNIKRQQAIKENLYVYLLQKREELSLSYAATLTDAKVIDNAYSGPARKPKVFQILAFAIFLGLGLPVGIIYAKESIKHTISVQEDIKGITNAIVLGKIYHYSNKKGNNVFATCPDGKTTETFRTLRTNLNFALKSSSHNTILVTSCLSGEGKSFNALNIAASYAQMGKRTILIDFDLRNSHSIIDNTDQTTGLSLYLNAEVTLNQIIQKSGFINLDFIHSGPVPSNPAELMEKELNADLFEYVKMNYEYIVIDTPPLAQVSDALPIFKYASLKLIVTRFNVTKKKLLRVVLNELRIKNISNVYILLNDNKLISEQLGYGYYNKK